MTAESSKKAKDYYNSSDADAFYFETWGGEHIHIGLYENNEDTVVAASHRTVDHMAELLSDQLPNTRVLDLGSGFGGTARRLAKEFSCSVTALNISEVENQRHRKMNEEAELSSKIKVVDGNFENLDFPEAHFDVVWSQDAFLHSEKKSDVLSGVYRVLKPGGSLIFTDPMQVDTVDPSQLQAIYDRIHLHSLGSVKLYTQLGESLGFSNVTFEDHSDQLPRHYGKILNELSSNTERLKGKITEEYQANMKKGLQLWVDGGNKGLLSWGIFHFIK